MTQSNQNAESLFNIGYALMQRGRLDEAINAYQQAVALQSDYWEAWNNLANAFMQKGELAQAIRCFDRANELQPNHPPTQYGRAHALRLAGRRREAIAVLAQCLNANPDLPPILDELATALDEEGRTQEAIAVLRHLCKVQPDLPEAHNRLGALLAESNVDTAIAEFNQAIALRPNFAEAQSNLGLALSQAGRFDEAEAAHHKAIDIDPHFAEARWNLGCLQLQRGDYESGWKNYEARRELKRSIVHRSFSQPMWDGSDLNGRRILLHSEQGFGDTIQFVRYAPLVAERGGKVLLSCQPTLQRLLTSVLGVEQVIGSSDPPPPFDLQCPLGSLPFLFGTTMASIPARVPYLSADQDSMNKWRDRLSKEPGKLKVGIAWAGNPSHGHDRSRSIDPELLAPLAQIACVTLVSLQKDSGRPATDWLAGLLDWTDELKDFADTAALICALDLVISVDTAVVHLTGAMGRPVWLMLSTAAEWRYLPGRTDSPWYPTLRIFRQAQAGEWASVVSDVARELHKSSDSSIPSPGTRGGS
jgi:Flp pilus assembly protein TadD